MTTSADLSSQAAESNDNLNPKTKDSIIKLNVGGAHFSTFHSTLVKSKYFASLLCEDAMSSKTLIDTDVIFIDRSGDLFRDILYYLRTGSVTTSNKKKLTSLQREAEFYQLQELANLLERHMDRANREHKEFLVRDMDFLDVSNIGVTKYIAHRQHTGKVYVYQIIGVIDVLISGYCQNHRKHGCTECHAQKLILRSSSKTLV